MCIHGLISSPCNFRYKCGILNKNGFMVFFSFLVQAVALFERKRRCRLAEVGVVFLEKVWYWDLVLEFHKSKTGPVPLSLFQLPTIQMQNSQLLIQKQLSVTIFPFLLIIDCTSETLRDLQLNAFFYRNCCGHGFFGIRQQKAIPFFMIFLNILTIIITSTFLLYISPSLFPI